MTIPPHKTGSVTNVPPTIEIRSYEPDQGDPPLILDSLNFTQTGKPQRSNFFTILLIEGGTGNLSADLSHHTISGPSIWFLNPYQIFLLSEDIPLRGARLQFHANFFCIETHHQEIGCNGVLFNNPYRDPQVSLDENLTIEFRSMFTELEREIGKAEVANSEMLISLLKILMIRATRLKLSRTPENTSPFPTRIPESITLLVEMVEENYTTIHRPADYASRLAITPKALGKLTKRYLGITVSEMIHGRILNHAKWQLLHTLRPVKEIAAEVGYKDEYYFSRFFKLRTGMSPTGFRKYETRIRGGSNLSI